MGPLTSPAQTKALSLIFLHFVLSVVYHNMPIVSESKCEGDEILQCV